MMKAKKDLLSWYSDKKGNYFKNHLAEKGHRPIFAAH